MNFSWAALAGEAVVNYRGEIAGHARGGTFSYALLPLRGEGDLDLLAISVGLMVLRCQH